jgi:hypothetical protein
MPNDMIEMRRVIDGASEKCWICGSSVTDYLILGDMIKCVPCYRKSILTMLVSKANICGDLCMLTLTCGEYDELFKCVQAKEYLEHENGRLRAFVEYALDAYSWDNTEPDGGDLQDKAESLKLIELRPIDPEDAIEDETEHYFCVWTPKQDLIVDPNKKVAGETELWGITEALKSKINEDKLVNPDFILHGLLIDPVSQKAIDWMQPEPYQIKCKDEAEKAANLLKINNAGFVVKEEVENV